MNNFESLGLSKKLLQAVESEGYTTPTPVQEQSIPPLLAGRDVLGVAQTGTGKTAAFAMVAICVPYDQQAQHPGNGNMLALSVKRDDIDRVYRKAIELGATDEGEPGERLPVFYGAYIRDPDGNKICFYEMTL